MCRQMLKMVCTDHSKSAPSPDLLDLPTAPDYTGDRIFNMAPNLAVSQHDLIRDMVISKSLITTQMAEVTSCSTRSIKAIRSSLYYMKARRIVGKSILASLRTLVCVWQDDRQGLRLLSGAKILGVRSKGKPVLQTSVTMRSDAGNGKDVGRRGRRLWHCRSLDVGTAPSHWGCITEIRCRMTRRNERQKSIILYFRTVRMDI
jgi:hypothetical protein